MSRKPIPDEEQAKREQAWLDSLCDDHAGQRVGLLGASYRQWRQRQMDMPSNAGICPVCAAARKRRSG
ncbi:hypothetical protein [Anaeroselena agilis]|uniref:Uncharacterized protein n=1 Tax=Anaeroselena agilis TaxID=3063788 RepID=A0ABU3NWH1_9FIRM|nr:hypothetical protein [Selenomonadales bacterium 4137-cl]